MTIVTADLSPLASLPALMSTESRETAELTLPLLYRCRWHGLSWLPVEAGPGPVLFGLTVRIVLEWRFFDVRELETTYGGDAVELDHHHLPAPAHEVSLVRLHRLDDLTPFLPSNPRVG